MSHPLNFQQIHTAAFQLDPMIIEDIEAYPVELEISPYEEPHGLAPYIAGYSGYNNKVDRTLIRVYTNSGISGWGEMFTVLPAKLMVEYIEEEIGNKLVGESLNIINSFSINTAMHSYIDSKAITGGVEIALWDCLGKHLGAPVHQLLGGKIRDKIDYAYLLGIQELDQTVESVEFAKSQGFQTIKTKVGGYHVDSDPEDFDYTRSLHSDIDRLSAIADTLGPNGKIRIDANQSLNVSQTLSIISELSKLDIQLEYFEQPLPRAKTSAYERLMKRSNVPIAINEDAYSANDFENMLQSNVFDVGVVDIVPAGGFLQTRKLAAKADSNGVPLTHHCGFHMGVSTAAVLNLVATTPEFSIPPGTTYYSHKSYILEDPFELESGSIKVPNEPGLGVSVDLDAVKKISVK